MTTAVGRDYWREFGFLLVHTCWASGLVARGTGRVLLFAYYRTVRPSLLPVSVRPQV